MEKDIIREVDYIAEGIALLCHTGKGQSFKKIQQDLEKKYAEAKVRVTAKTQKKEDMFSAKYFAYVFAGYCVFFLLLSLFFGSFFRSKTVN